MSSSAQQLLIDYLNDGGAIYIEGVDVGWSHRDTEFFGMFGAELVHHASGEVWELHGQSNMWTSQFRFVYDGGSDSHVRIDELGSNGGELLFACEQNKGRIIANAQNNYRTICSSILLGAIHDGDGDLTKANLMRQYLDFLESK